MLLVGALGILISVSAYYLEAEGTFLSVMLGIASAVVSLYLLWKTAELVAGHDKVYGKYELLEHKSKKDSTAFWFIIGIIPIANLYLLWKTAELISGHDTYYK